VLACADGAAWVRAALVRYLVCRNSSSTCSSVAAHLLAAGAEGGGEEAGGPLVAHVLQQHKKHSFTLIPHNSTGSKKLSHPAGPIPISTPVVLEKSTLSTTTALQSTTYLIVLQSLNRRGSWSRTPYFTIVFVDRGMFPVANASCLLCRGEDGHKFNEM
jgi:hypothetical protein